MIIVFKNGKTIRVSQDVVNSLCKQILSEKGASTFQIFERKDNKDNFGFVINISDISYIKD